MSAQVLIITGGSRGIGAATTRLASQRGFSICVNYLQQKGPAEQLVSEIRRQGGAALAVQADISSEPDVLRLFETVDREFGRVTALVNNAANLELQTRLESLDLPRLQRMFATNVFGAFLCAREAVRRMSTRHGGSGGAIVNVSSMAAVYGSPGEYIDYAASKAALDTLTVGLAREVAEEGIRVNGVRAGHIYTDLHARTGEPGRVDRLKPSIPMKRGGRPEEVAAAIVWLLSSEASYVTGAILNVSGGR